MKCPHCKTNVQDLDDSYVSYEVDAPAGSPRAHTTERCRDVCKRQRDDFKGQFTAYMNEQRAYLTSATNANDALDKDYGALVATYTQEVGEARTQVRKADRVLSAAREMFAANDDGHECVYDGTECPSCRVKDAFREYDAS